MGCDPLLLFYSFVAEVCWFINKDEDEDEEEEEPEDAGTDSAPPDTNDDPPADAGADGS